MNSSTFASFFDTPEVPELGPGPRAGVVPLPVVRDKLEVVLTSNEHSATAANLIRALVLLWHDHLEAAHALAQEIDNPDGSYVHAIMHRREPDYDNAKYWFRRVGQHPAFAQLKTRATELLHEAKQSEWAERLAPGGRWDAFAFVDACAAAAESRGGSGVPATVLRQIQKAEFEILLRRLEATRDT